MGKRRGIQSQSCDEEELKPPSGTSHSLLLFHIPQNVPAPHCYVPLAPWPDASSLAAWPKMRVTCGTWCAGPGEAPFQTRHLIVHRCNPSSAEVKKRTTLRTKEGNKEESLPQTITCKVSQHTDRETKKKLEQHSYVQKKKVRDKSNLKTQPSFSQMLLAKEWTERSPKSLWIQRRNPVSPTSAARCSLFLRHPSSYLYIQPKTWMLPYRPL